MANCSQQQWTTSRGRGRGSQRNGGHQDGGQPHNYDPNGEFRTPPPQDRGMSKDAYQRQDFHSHTGQGQYHRSPSPRNRNKSPYDERRSRNDWYQSPMSDSSNSSWGRGGGRRERRGNNYEYTQFSHHQMMSPDGRQRNRNPSPRNSHQNNSQGGWGGRHREYNSDVDLSKKLSFLLRHGAEKQGFTLMSGFPNVLSCVDGTFIKIQAPCENEADFINRKGYHSLNVQMACDSRYRITNVVAKWLGSVHDARIFRGLHMCFKFEKGSYDGILLGDSGYPCMMFLMTPYSHPSTPSHIRYNDALCKTRVKIEQTFGILKRRFPCLSLGLRVDPMKASIITLACAVLHNIRIDRNEIIVLPEEDEESNEDSVACIKNDGNGNTMRDHIRSTFFL